MHVIAKPILVDFWTLHPDAESPLSAWYHLVKTEVFADFNDLRRTFAGVDVVEGLIRLRYRWEQIPADRGDSL